MRKNSQNFPDAIRGESVYADWDEETELYHVFGLESGHSYASYCDFHIAKERASVFNLGR